MSKFWSEMVKRCEPYVPGEQLDQQNILKLNTNENPYPPSPIAIEAIKEELDRKLNLYPSPTVDQLRNEAAKYYGLSKENIFAGNGSDEVLAFSFMAFFEPGRKIRFPMISYSFYPVYAKLFNIPYEEIELNRDFSLPAEAFFQSEGGVIFPNPNAPTSVYLELDAIKDIAENNPGQIVIIDEAYIDFASISAISLTKTYDNVLVVQTMSKSRSLAGLRVGFAIGNPDLIEALYRIKDSFNSYTIDRLAIAGATAAMKDIEYFNHTTQKIVQTREWAAAEMKKRGFHVLPSATNFIFACHYSKNAADLYTGLKRENVLVRYFNKSEIDNFLRITIGTDEDMKLFFEKLDSLIRKASTR